ncbi:MAG: hypothetical protein ACRDNF_14850, partial [Streptosporangiaceae bacterium]
LTLNGNFDVAFCSASEDSSLKQPKDDAAILLSAFAASSKKGGPRESVRQLSAAQARQALAHLGNR